ncbi:MAG: HAD family acid phosphatase [Longimicrobiales bacterium]|nr:HAD family acid phosphatase [Longimicrobiales bacterium]
MNRTLRPSAVLLALSLVLAGCAGAAPGAPPAGAPGGEAAHPVPPGVHWFRTAAEQHGIYRQVYAWAGERVMTAATGMVEPWGVILDADETVLDNSLYQLRRARAGLGFSPESWNEWVREEVAPALPGAVDFIERIRARGGRVAIVTNRDEAVCEPTRRNLAAVGVRADVVLCRAPGVSEKETRFRAVHEGTAAPGLPPLRILAWVGDNIRDFPGGGQGWREDPGAAGADIGVRFFLLPNPMYGSWESNPVR